MPSPRRCPGVPPRRRAERCSWQGVPAAAGKVEAELQPGHRGRGVPGLKRPRSGGARVALVKNNKGLKEIGAAESRFGGARLPRGRAWPVWLRSP